MWTDYDSINPEPMRVGSSKQSDISQESKVRLRLAKNSLPIFSEATTRA